jgi:hypothetical protein
MTSITVERVVLIDFRFPTNTQSETDPFTLGSNRLARTENSMEALTMLFKLYPARRIVQGANDYP